MKCTTIIDNERKEVLIYTDKITNETKAIECFVLGLETEIQAYKNKETILLSQNEVYCFTSENGSIYAITENEKLLVKQRIFQLEELLSDNFVKINQSSLANITKIKRFDASFGGSLLVIFKNGYRDYVSRRQTKAVKERIGIK
ncbi:MAG: LytTR family transcriptional regulator DNA-binding domain-containing protein [Clostridia bacterium]|nr:LytTR family transcriptional regulator DNA-binding domain-containing protein [Clostridia bacterium]